MTDHGKKINFAIRTWIPDSFSLSLGISLFSLVVSFFSLLNSYKQTSIGEGANTKVFWRDIRGADKQAHLDNESLKRLLLSYTNSMESLKKALNSGRFDNDKETCLRFIAESQKSENMSKLLLQTVNRFQRIYFFTLLSERNNAELLHIKGWSAFSNQMKIDWWAMELSLTIINADWVVSTSYLNCTTQKLSIDEKSRVESTVDQTIKKLRKSYFSLMFPSDNPVIEAFENLEKVNKF